jgi:acetylornithine deacetylase/succinyl-diaminopimelate desuccinylase-like protein
MAHQPDEYVELRQVTQAAEIYARIIEDLLGDDSDRELIR